MGMRHLQLSVDAARWPDEMLDGYMEEDGRPLSGAEVRAYLQELKAAGYVVVPCGRCVCDETGRCTGVPLAPTTEG